jgi:hypothetical protein
MLTILLSDCTKNNTELKSIIRNKWLDDRFRGKKYPNKRSGDVSKSRIKKKLENNEIDSIPFGNIKKVIKIIDEMKIDTRIKKNVFDKVHESILELIDAVPWTYRMEILESFMEKFLTLRNERIYEKMSKKLERINTHPGILFNEFNFILDEVGIDPLFTAIGNVDISVYHPNRRKYSKPYDISDELDKISIPQLETAMKNILLGDILDKLSRYGYWFSKKINSDAKFLLAEPKFLNILRDIEKVDMENKKREKLKKDNPKIRYEILAKRGVTPHLRLLCKLGLISYQNELNEFDVISRYKEVALKLIENCPSKNKFKDNFNKIGCDDCINKKNIELFKIGKSNMMGEPHLTEYGKNVLKNINKRALFLLSL